MLMEVLDGMMMMMRFYKFSLSFCCYLFVVVGVEKMT